MRLRHKHGVILPYFSHNVGGNIEDLLVAKIKNMRDVEVKRFRGEMAYLLKALSIILTGRKISA